MSDDCAIAPPATALLPRELRVSVVICSHNGASNLPSTLAALARNASSFGHFELIIVDSASTEDLLSAEASRHSVAKLEAFGVNVVMIRCQRLGLTLARVEGARAARTDIICLLDDDNEVHDHYIARGVSNFDDDRLGVLVSRISPRFAAPAPSSIVRRQHLLAISEFLGDRRIVWDPGIDWCPTIGAGMWVRRRILLEIYSDPPKAVLPDRTGSKLISEGDIEIGIWAGRLGYRRTYAPDVCLDHFIPASRLRICYFLRLINGVVRSQATLNEIYHLRKPPRRWWRWLLLPGFVLMAAGVAATRRDCLREFAFIVAAELAECLGPYDLSDLKEPA
ncbi:MAG: glycosyltransferase [Planctomycetaceae bacterium]|nr:glycosyltransferase [Planctomycetaceae bacterium]